MSAENNVKVSDNFRILYNDVKEGISTLLQSVRSSYPNVDTSITRVKELLEGVFDVENNSLVSNIAGVLSQISIIAYLQEFDNDKNFDKLRDTYTKKIVLKDKDGNDLKDKNGNVIEEVKKFANTELDFKFGFTELLELIQVGVELMESNEVGESIVEGKLTANLLSNIRDISAEEYLSGGYIEKDLALVTLLNESPEEDFNLDIFDFINSNHDLKTIYNSAKDSILGVYKYTFQDSFGLRPYVGVLSFQGNSIYTIGADYHLSTIPKAHDVFKKIASQLSDEYSVVQSDSRQFDFDTIINSNKAVYFPKKILEYALGRKLTYELSLNLYRPLEEAKSWEQYEEAYVSEQVDKECLHAIYKSLQRNTDYDFNSEDFKSEWKDNQSGIKAKLNSMQLHDAVKADIQKIVRSMCTGVVVTSYNSLNDSVNSAKLRVIDVYKKLSLNITGKLFSSFSSNDSIVYYDGMVLTEGKKLSDGNTPLPYNVIEYGHDFNEKLSEAEPLFGYTAVDLFKQRGIPITWDRILVGEDIKGTPLFADLEDQDGIPLQSNAVHNIMAGSRSGKGVMTMNMLAVGLGSDKPIFYVDRKPDMSVMFYEMTDGNMFVVNGGQYLSKNDPRSVFADTGSAIKGWDTWYDKMPRYLKKLFPKRTYVGDFGDYVYFRAMLFCISLVIARAEFASDANIYDSLGGENGVVFVFDEFKNWQENFEQKFFTPNGIFGGHRLDNTTKSKYRKNKRTIESKLNMLNSGDLKPDREINYKNTIKDLTEENEELITPVTLYCHTLMDKYGDTIKAVSTLLSAGFKDGEAPKTDIFVIGQHIEIDGYNDSATPHGTYPERDSGKFNCNEDTKGKSLMRGLLDSFFHDWFMGYNEDGDSEKNYMGASEEGTEPNRLILKKRYWGYCNGTPLNDLRESAPNKVVYFKPYLVLNNALEDDPKNPEKIVDSATGKTISNPDYSFVKQCRDRVNDAVPNLWETVRLKHLNDGCEVTDDNKWYGHLNQGVGFEGLANAICQTQGKVLDKETSLKASLDIADFVAKKMGYASYKDLLFDFSPEGLFSSEDVIFAIRNGAEAYKKNVRDRLPLFTEYNLSDNKDEESEDKPDFNTTANTEDMFDFGEITPPTPEPAKSSNSSSQDFNSSPNNQSSQFRSAENHANDFYSQSDKQVTDEGEDDDIGFTKEVALMMINNTFDNYDKMHPSAPIRHLVHDYELEEFAELLVSVVNN